MFSFVNPSMLRDRQQQHYTIPSLLLLHIFIVNVSQTLEWDPLNIFCPWKVMASRPSTRLGSHNSKWDPLLTENDSSSVLLHVMCWIGGGWAGGETRIIHVALNSFIAAGYFQGIWEDIYVGFFLRHTSAHIMHIPVPLTFGTSSHWHMTKGDFFFLKMEN